MSKIDKSLNGETIVKRYQLGAAATSTYGGIPYVMTPTTGGVGPCTTTAATDAVGVSTGPAIVAYSTTQSVILANGEGLVDIAIGIGLVLESVESGTAAEGGAKVVYANTSASAGGTVVTCTFPSADVDGGTIWRYQNGVAGEWRVITTSTSTTSKTVTVPFSTAIAVGDTFLFSPYGDTGNGASGGDGNNAITLTTLLTQADSTAASGAGIIAAVVDFVPGGTNDTIVRWMLRDHIFSNLGTIAP